MSNELKMQLIDNFLNNQTLTELQKLNNAGVGLFIIKSGEFVIMKQYELPLNKERQIKIYQKVNAKLIISGIGFY